MMSRKFSRADRLEALGHERAPEFLPAREVRLEEIVLARGVAHMHRLRILARR